MHLGNEAITTECMLLGYGLTATSLAASCYFPSPEKQPRVLQIIAAGAFVFAAQMLNFSVGLPFSTHLVGGVLLAYWLGPAIGLRTMACILALQVLLLGDGGAASWGVNVCNMAVIPAAMVLWLQRAQRQSAAMLGWSAAGAVLAAACLIPLEVAVGRTGQELQTWQAFFQLMLGNHIVASLAEGLLTVALILGWQQLDARQPKFSPQLAIGFAMLLMMVAPFLSSERPDGYEAAAANAWQSLLPEEPQ